METREITKQAKQNLTIFKKQLHECQCKENRLAEYYRKEWLTKGEFIKKMRKLEEKRAGFAKKYLTKYSKFKNFGGETSPEQENYAWDAAIIVSSWSTINSPLPIKELVTLSGIISVVAKRIRNSLRLLSEKKKEREI